MSASALVIVGVGRWKPLFAAVLLAFVVSMKLTVAALNLSW